MQPNHTKNRDKKRANLLDPVNSKEEQQAPIESTALPDSPGYGLQGKKLTTYLSQLEETAANPENKI
jgi:hypothetical protein